MKYLLLILLLFPLSSNAHMSKWEPCMDQTPVMKKMETPYGWIVRFDGEYHYEEHYIYINDPKHLWDCNKDDR